MKKGKAWLGVMVVMLLMSGCQSGAGDAGIALGDNVYVLATPISSVKGSSLMLEVYQVSGKTKQTIWTSSQLHASIEAIDSEAEQIALVIPQFDLHHTLSLTSDERQRWHERLPELQANGIALDETYYDDIRDNLLLVPMDFAVTETNTDGEKGIALSLDVSTVGSKTPYIRDEAVLALEMDNGAICASGMTFKRELVATDE